MAQNYNVDDILEEIRRKKEAQKAADASGSYRSAASSERQSRSAARQEAPRQPAENRAPDRYAQRPRQERPLEQRPPQREPELRERPRQEQRPPQREPELRERPRQEQRPPQREPELRERPRQEQRPSQREPELQERPRQEQRPSQREPELRERPRQEQRLPQREPELRERPRQEQRLAFDEFEQEQEPQQMREPARREPDDRDSGRRQREEYGEFDAPRAQQRRIEPEPPRRIEPEPPRRIEPEPQRRMAQVEEPQDVYEQGDYQEYDSYEYSRPAADFRDSRSARRQPRDDDARYEQSTYAQAEPAAKEFVEDNFVLPNFEDTTDLPKERQTSSAKFVSFAPEGDYTRTTAVREQEPVRPATEYTQEMPRPRRRRMGFRQEEDEEDQGGLTRSPWHDSYAAQEALEQETTGEDDFATPQDAPYVEKELQGVHSGLKLKTTFTAICAALSLYLTLSLKELPFAALLKLAEGTLLPLPPFLAPENYPRIFLGAHLLLCITAALLGGSIMASGISALLKMRANRDTAPALAVFGVLVQGMVLMFFPQMIMESEHVSLYFSVAIVIMLFQMFGKLSLIRRIRRNFDFMMDGREKFAFAQIQSRDFEREFTRGIGPEPGRVAYIVKSGFFTRFLDKSYSSDYGESLTRISAPVSLLGAVLVAVITAVLSKDAATAVSAFAAILCICAPLSSAIVPNLMLGRVSKKLTRLGLMLPGYESAENVDDTGAVIVTDRDIFLPENVVLHGMKVFAEKRIDEAILDAASVIISCDGIMSGVFMNMIGGERRLLKSVDSIMYEDGMGISAWVDGKRVLIGNQELMRTHDIDCPSRDFESRYIRDGRQVLYLANSGELTAMFVVSYNGDPLTADLLKSLEARGVYPVIWTTDPNVTADQISLAFGIKRTHVRIMPAKMHGEYHFLVRPKKRICADGVMQDTSLENIWMIVRAAFAVKMSVVRASIVELIGIAVGYGLIAVMAFTASMSQASYLTLLLYLMISFIVSTIVALLPRP